MLDQKVPQHSIVSPDESPIFVIGTGRSGTTLLRQMLNAHPRIHITHEAAFYTYARHAPRDVSIRAWLERYFETFSFAWLRLDPQEILDALSPVLKEQRLVDAYRTIMRCKARHLNKPRYGDKNPLDTHNLERIFEDFADPRIIYITRDPRPTVFSFNRMPFGASSVLLNSFLCKVQFQHIQPYLGRILEVRLEDLVASPAEVMQNILRFVGEPWDEAVLDHVHQAVTDDVPPLPWFVAATQDRPNERQSGGSWREKMDPVWIRLVERINQAAMQRYGYKVSSLPQEPRLSEFAGAVLRDFPGIASTVYRMLSFKRKLDRHFNNQERLDPQEGMETNVRLNPSAWKYYPDFQMPQVPQLPAARGA
jgi:hypothetical protein